MHPWSDIEILVNWWRGKFYCTRIYTATGNDKAGNFLSQHGYMIGIYLQIKNKDNLVFIC